MPTYTGKTTRGITVFTEYNYAPLGITLSNDEYPISVTLNGTIKNPNALYFGNVNLYLCNTEGNNQYFLSPDGSIPSESNIPKAYQDPNIPWHNTGGNNGETIQVENMVYGERKVTWTTTLEASNLKNAALALKRVEVGNSQTDIDAGFMVTVTTGYDKKKVTLKTNNSAFGTLTVHGTSDTSADVRAGATLKIVPEPATGCVLQSVVATAGTLTTSIETTDGVQTQVYLFKMPTPAVNTTITATFKRIVYTISVEKNQDAPECVVQVPSTGIYGSSITATSTTTDTEKYRFQPWTSSKTLQDSAGQDVDLGDEAITFNMPDSNLTLYANWLRHAIIWSKPSISITQDSDILTITMDGSAIDNFDDNNENSITYYLYKNGNEYGQIQRSESKYQITYQISPEEANTEIDFSIYAHTARKENLKVMGVSTMYVPKDFHSYVQYWDGEKFITCIPKRFYYENNEWIEEEVMMYYYNGSKFILCSYDPLDDVLNVINYWKLAIPAAVDGNDRLVIYNSYKENLIEMKDDPIYINNSECITRIDNTISEINGNIDYETLKVTTLPAMTTVYMVEYNGGANYNYVGYLAWLAKERDKNYIQDAITLIDSYIDILQQVKTIKEDENKTKEQKTSELQTLRDNYNSESNDKTVKDFYIIVSRTIDIVEQG